MYRELQDCLSIEVVVKEEVSILLWYSVVSRDRAFIIVELKQNIDELDFKST